MKVVWSCADDDAGEPQFRMQWIEAGGPEVMPPAHKGFGQMVLEQLVARALQGEAAVPVPAERGQLGPQHSPTAHHLRTIQPVIGEHARTAGDISPRKSLYAVTSWA